VIRTLARFTRVEDRTKKVALLGVSGYQPLIIEFADSLENVERAMMRIAELTTDKALTAVDVEISPSTVPLRLPS
jgi:PII-like signaling protein